MYVCVWQCGWERRMRSSAGACWHHEPSAVRGRRSETASRSDLTRASLVSRKASPRLPHAVWSVSRSARRKALLSAACWKPSLHPQLRLDCACLCSLRMLHFVDPAPSSQCRVLSSPDASPVLSCLRDRGRADSPQRERPALPSPRVCLALRGDPLAVLASMPCACSCRACRLRAYTIICYCKCIRALTRCPKLTSLRTERSSFATLYFAGCMFVCGSAAGSGGCGRARAHVGITSRVRFVAGGPKPPRARI